MAAFVRCCTSDAARPPVCSTAGASHQFRRRSSAPSPMPTRSSTWRVLQGTGFAPFAGRDPCLAKLDLGGLVRRGLQVVCIARLYTGLRSKGSWRRAHGGPGPICGILDHDGARCGVSVCKRTRAQPPRPRAPARRRRGARLRASGPWPAAFGLGRTIGHSADHP
jgi:hypothetical protein